jgi:hypothetical protein
LNRKDDLLGGGRGRIPPLGNGSKRYCFFIKKPGEDDVEVGINDPERGSARVPEIQKAISVCEVEESGANLL